MSFGNIKISELNNIGSINTEDFLPLVHSASMTTYRASIAAIAPLITSSIYASQSISSSWSAVAVSASYASMSFNAVTASYFNFTLPNSIPPFASASLSSSWASSSISASYASRSFLADTASYFNFTLPNTTPPFASASFSSSWASSSVSSSYLSGTHYGLHIGPTTGSVFGTASYASSASYVATASYFLPASQTPYPYIYSMSFWASHDDDVNVAFGNHPVKTWNSVAIIPINQSGFTSASNSDPFTGMFQFQIDGLGHSEISYDAIATRYVMQYHTQDSPPPYYSTPSIATGSLTGPLQRMVIFFDNRNGGNYTSQFYGPIVVIFATGPGQFKKYSAFPSFMPNTSWSYQCPYSSVSIDARLVGYEQFDPLTAPIYQGFINNIYYSNTGNPPIELEVSSSYL